MDQILIKSVVSSSEAGDCGLKPYCLVEPLRSGLTSLSTLGLEGVHPVQG